MEFGVTKNSLLRVLRSDLTGVELKTGRGNIHLLDGDTTTSDDSGEILSSPDSGDSFIVHTHEDVVASLSKQLQIQKEITDLCERDLQYRTEIIELLTARIVQLESETVSWKSREKELFELKEKMQFMEQLYGGEGARELEFGASEQPTVVPEGHIIVEITYLEDLKNQIESSKTDMKSWRIRSEKLELSLVEEQGKSASSREELSKIQSNHQDVLKASEREMGALKLKVEELLAAQSQAAARNAELMSSLEEANKRVQQLTLDIGVAEEMRNASLASVTAEAHEYATLRGRLTELEGQLSTSEEKKASVEQDLQDTSVRLHEAQGKLTNLTSKVEELEADLDKAEGEIAKFETTSTGSAQNVSALEIRLETSSKEHQTRVTELQSEMDTLRTERDNMKQVVTSLEGSLKQHEAANQKHTDRILELDGVSEGLSEQLSQLRQELTSSEQRYEELKDSSVSHEAELQAKLKEMQEKAAADSASRDNRIEELEVQIMVIREQCALHTSELEQTKASLQEAEASKSRLEESSLQVMELEGLLHERDEHVINVEKSLFDAKEQIRSHEERLAKEAEELEQLKKDHANRVAEYEGRLSDLTTGATTNASRHAALENEVSNLTAKVTTLEVDLATAYSEKESVRADLEQRIVDLQHSHKTQLTEAEAQSSALHEKLKDSEGLRRELQTKLEDTELRLTSLEQSIASGQSEASAAQSNIEASLKDALKKIAGLQTELDQKTSSLEQLELGVIHNSELEEQVETLTKERDTVTTKASTEKEELQKELVSLNAKVAETEQRLVELELALEKAKAEVSQRQLRIEAMEKEAREQGPSEDESHLQDLYAEHERQISQMEQDYDELRIERDEIIAERDNAIDQAHAHESRIHELEEKVHDLETHDFHMSSSFSSLLISSPVDMSDPHATVAELQARLRESEEKRQQAERVLFRRSYSGDSEADASDQSRDSIIIVDSVDEHGNSEVHEVHKIGSDGGSDTASERTADHSTMAPSISMTSTTTSQAEAEAEMARADQAEHEARRSTFPSLGTPKDEKEEKLTRRLSRHSSSGGFSIASALGGAGRMVGSIGHGEGHHLIPERIRKLSSRSKHEYEPEHGHEHEHHHRDVSNPFLLFARDRTDSGQSRRSSYSGSGSGGSRKTASVSSPPASGEEPLSPTKTAAMAERERKAKEKAAKLEKERAEKVAKIEKEKAAKAEKAAKREKERVEREQKEKERREAERTERERKEQERKARLKADPRGLDHITALRQGADAYYETN